MLERAEVSRRLKAARWLAGGIDEKGRPAPLTPDQLAQRERLVRNGITANALGEIERMIKDARPMELREIAGALGLPAAWFTAPREEALVDLGADSAQVHLSPTELRAAAALLGPQLLAAAQALPQAPAQEPPDKGEQDHSPGAAGGGT